MLRAKIAVFIIVTIALYRLSRESLHSFPSHGFYRFFAWEAVVALTLLNLDIRAYPPFSLHHLMAIMFLVLSGLLAIHGFLRLHREGRPDDRRDDPKLFWIERTTALVTSGAYKYIRHPLYAAFLLLTWGSYLFIPSWYGGFLALVASLNVFAAARVEEQENLLYFGEAYSAYMKRTKRFIPFVV